MRLQGPTCSLKAGVAAGCINVLQKHPSRKSCLWIVSRSACGKLLISSCDVAVGSWLCRGLVLRNQRVKIRNHVQPITGETEARGQSARSKPRLQIHKASDCPMTEKKTAGGRGPPRADEVPFVPMRSPCSTVHLPRGWTSRSPSSHPLVSTESRELGSLLAPPPRHR